MQLFSQKISVQDNFSFIREVDSLASIFFW